MNSKGYLPHTVIKGLVFWMLALCITAATASGILQAWGAVAEDVANKCLWTAFVLALGSIAFLIVNCLFGEMGHQLLGQGESPPRLDPAFSERLKRAKFGSSSDEPSVGTDDRAS